MESSIIKEASAQFRAVQAALRRWEEQPTTQHAHDLQRVAAQGQRAVDDWDAAGRYRTHEMRLLSDVVQHVAARLAMIRVT